jgi:hypothetical protein
MQPAKLVCNCSIHKTYQALTHIASFSVGACALLNYRHKDGRESDVMAVGRERSGQYAGQYNLCAGSGENTDRNSKGELCFLEILKREFREEFKFNTPFSNGIFDSFFKGSNGRIRYFMHNRTPIFVATLPTGTSRATIKNAMVNACNNSFLPWSEKEMDDFEYIRLDNGQQLEGIQIKVSSFADAVRRKVDIRLL